MTDNRVIQLSQASFRGVNFGVRSEAQDSSGRKIVFHEYVNSPERFIEDLGQLSPTFSIEAFVSGIDYLANSDRLESALNAGGFSTLVLPTLGSFRVQALAFQKKASQKAVGEIVFTLEFATGRPSAGPIRSLTDIQEVFRLGDNARQVIVDILGGKFEVPTAGDGISVFSSDLFVSALAAFNQFKDILPTENVGFISRIVDDIGRNSSQLTQNPDAIGKLFIVDGNTSGIFQSLSLGLTGSTFLDSLTAFTGMIDFTNFGEGDIFLAEDNRGAVSIDGGIPLWEENTAQRITKNTNRKNIANSNQVNALIAAYEIGANIEYNTVSELNENREALEAAHEQVMFIETSDETLIQSDPDVRVAVESVRIAALDVLEQKAQKSTETVDVIKLSPVSSFTEAFQRYAEETTSPDLLEERALKLRELNPSKPSIALSNGITVFRNINA